MPTIDLNCDLGEGYGAYVCGDDDALLSIVTSANVACGFHAGDPQIMARAFTLAKQRGVAVGAHPGYPDLWGFGRRPMAFTHAELERLLAYQIGAAAGLATYCGTRVTYVKCHGALANLCDRDRDCADAIARAIRGVDPSLVWLTIAHSAMAPAAQAAGLTSVEEVFADRGYTDAGHLIARGQPGAMILDPDIAAARVVEMVREGAIVSAAGRRLPTAIGSICVHGDSAHALASARRVRECLEAAGVRLAPFAPA